MATFFSFTQRNSMIAGASSANAQDDPIDPWNLGVATSTSTMETVGQPGSSDDVELAKNPPPTPEGLRPRKSIQRIRRDILESNEYVHETNISYNLPPRGEASSRSYQDIHRESPPSHSPSERSAGHGILPPSFQRVGGSPIRSTSSFYEQSITGSNYLYDEDNDINSSMDDSIYSRQPSSHYRMSAESPDLNRGGKPKTAVGAVLLAMAETSAQQKSETLNQRQFPSREYSGRRQQSILPPRSWMNEDRYMMNKHIDDDMIHDGSNRVDDDNESSLHASPSSLRRGVFPTSWPQQEHHNQNDSSFTRGILNGDPSSSKLEDDSIIGSPYDFNPIVQEEEPIDAPRLLSLEENNNRLNISAISNSYHPKELNSLNASLADTIEDDEDDEEECNEIPRYYHALPDDAPVHNILNDDAFIMRKVENQRLDKEDLLRSTFERFQDCLGLLRDLYSQNSVENSFFLGLAKTKDGSEFQRRLQVLLSDPKEGASYGSQRQAILFCLSVLQNAESISSNDAELHSKISTSFSPRWVPRPGFRSSLGLLEEPQSPQTIRGGDTSLFSLPSDSANETTPHTSNVSVATTITTVVSPERYRQRIQNQHQTDHYTIVNNQNGIDIHVQNTRKTMDSLARLLYRLEETCRGLKSKIRGKSMLMESFQSIYFELLNLSTADLKVIIDSFDMEYSETTSLTRTVSNDEEAQNEPTTFQEHLAQTKDTVRVNVVESENDDIDSGNMNQSIECDLWGPTTNDMASLVSPQNEEENQPILNENGYAELKDDEPFDDLRRTVGSFDSGNVEDEREGPATSEEPELDHRASFPATFARRVVGRRSKKSRFWKKRFLALKNRGQQVTAE